MVVVVAVTVVQVAVVAVVAVDDDDKEKRWSFSFSDCRVAWSEDKAHILRRLEANRFEVEKKKSSLEGYGPE